MEPSTSGTEYESSDTEDEKPPPVKRHKSRDVDEVISDLHRQLNDGFGNKYEFDRNFEVIIANKGLLKPRQIQWLSESSATGLNFLMLACKYGNEEAVEFLISSGQNLNKKDEYDFTASDHAWEIGSFQCLAKLLKADAPFPKQFDVEALGVSELKLEIIGLVKKMHNLHRNIQEGNLGEVQCFVDENPTIRFAYDKTNRCALTTALEFKHIKIYSFLRNKFYEAAVDSVNHKSLLEELPGTVKKQLFDHLRSNSKKPIDDHVMVLLAKSRDLTGNKENIKKLVGFYETLNEVPQICPILKIVAESEATNIIFDFSNENFSKILDPTDGPPTAVTYQHKGYILIAAGREDVEVLGNLAHKLTHWALQLVYDDSSKPFFIDGSNDHREVYEKLVEKYARPDNWAGIVEKFIVEIPEWLVKYKDRQNMIIELREKYEDLFIYFEETFLRDIEQELLTLHENNKHSNIVNPFAKLHNLLVHSHFRRTKKDFKTVFSLIVENRKNLTNYQISLLNETSPTGMNFLMLACKYGNVEAVDLLISCDINVNTKDSNEFTASDYAWKHKNFSCLVKLLNADAPFPREFDLELLNQAEEKQEIEKIITTAYNFHEKIKDGKFEEVEAFTTKNPEVRFGYNWKNQCALTTALEHNRIKIYGFLLYDKFFEAGIDSDNLGIRLEELPNNSKKWLREKFQENLKKPVAFALLAKSRDRSRSTKNFNEIIGLYENLLKVPQIRPILELVAASDQTNIVFDFTEEGVHGMDPMASKNTLGLMYPNCGYILIGAKCKKRDKDAKNKVLGTIAHEFTHWALQLVYKNKSLPFFNEKDGERKKQYEKLIQKYKIPENRTVDCKIIDWVFDSELYEPASISKELIVRVPHLLAFYKDNSEELEKIRKAYEDLFIFFEEHLLRDIEQELLTLHENNKHLDNVDPFANLHFLLVHSHFSRTKKAFERVFSLIVDNQKNLNNYQISLLNETSPTGMNFLMLACKYGNVEVVDLLISCGINVNTNDNNDFTASDYAWKHKNFSCLVKLLNADAPFPREFDLELLNQAEEKQEIEKIITTAYNFHEKIKDGKFEEVKALTTKNPKVRFGYNGENQCALTTALEHNRIKIYGFLLYDKFFEAGIDSDNLSIRLEKLPGDSKEWLREELKRNLKKPVAFALLAKSRDRSRSTKNFNEIIGLYENLLKVPQIRPILELVAASDQTNIVFDFTENRVHGMDPMASKNTLGLMYPNCGYILIGAKCKKRDKDAKNKVLGTIAHEFTHWALQLVYKNKSLPFFFKNDRNRRSLYEELVEKYKIPENRTVNCKIIEEVFNTEIYDPATLSKELIVRVPHLLAFYKDNSEEMEKIRKAYEDLFVFFEKHILPNIEIRNLNKMFGTLEDSLKLDMLSSECDKKIDFGKYLFIKSTTSELLQEYVVKIMHKNTNAIEAKSLFLYLDQLFDPENLERLIKASKSEVKPKIFVVDSDKEAIVDGMLLEKIRELRPIVILSITRKTSCWQNIEGSEIEVNFGWDDLSHEAKTEIINQKLFSQDSAVHKDRSESILKKLPLKIILNLRSTEVRTLNETLPEKPRVFIERRYLSKENITQSNDDLVNLADFLFKNKTVLIADSAGMGKSTAAIQLARELQRDNQFSWVVFIDLKQHTKVFLRDEQKSQPEITDLSFFTEKILKLEAGFKWELYECLYEIKEIIFIIDGFDEISPKYKQFVLNMLRTIKNSGNRLLVTTRPHFTRKLEEELATKAIRLIPFERHEQIDFLIRYWRFQEPQDIDLKSRAEFFLENFEKHWNVDDFCANPLHIFMLAESFAKEVPSNVDETTFNIFLMYEKFFEMKLWIKKEPLVSDDIEKLGIKPVADLTKIFHRLAIEQIFSPVEAEKLKIPEVDDCFLDETIARVGIVAFGSGKSPEFTHRTYAEFFIADLIASQVFRIDPSDEYVELLVKIILSREFGQIQKFLNDKLESMKTFDINKLTKFIGENLKEKRTELNFDSLKNFDSQCSIPNVTSNVKLFNLILEAIDFDCKLKQQLIVLLWQNYGYHIVYFETIWRHAEKIQDETFLNELLFTKVCGRNILIRALNHEYVVNAKVLERVSLMLIECSESSLDEGNFAKFYHDEKSDNSLIHEIISINVDTFEVVWAAAERKLRDKNDLKKLALEKDRDGNTILHLLAGHHDVLMKWLEVIKKLLNSDEFNEHLIAKNNDSRLFIEGILSSQSKEIEELTKVWEFIKRTSSKETQRKLLFDKNGLCEVIFIEQLLRKSKKLVVNYIFDIVDSFLQNKGGESLIDLLRSRGSLVDFVLHMIVDSAEYFDKYSGKLEEGEFRNILLSKTSARGNVLQCLVESKNSGSLLSKIVEKINDLQKVEALLFHDDGKYLNIFNNAAQNNNLFLIDLLNWCDSNFDHVFMKKIFVPRNVKHTLLHEVAEFCDKNLIDKCFKFVLKSFKPIEQQEMFLQENTNGLVPIEMSFANRNHGIVEIVAEFYKKVLYDRYLRKICSGIKLERLNCQLTSKQIFELKSELESRWKIEITRADQHVLV